MKNKVAVFIGRFQPFHQAHKQIVLDAINNGYQHIVVLVGSSNQARTPKNPFTFWERKKFIEASLLDYQDKVKISILLLQDYVYDHNKWLAEAQSQIKSVTKPEDRITLIGNLKDKTSEYLNYFPQYEKDFSTGIVFDGLSATKIREKFFKLYDKVVKIKETQSYLLDLETLLKASFVNELDDAVVKQLISFAITKPLELHSLVEEFNYLNNYRKTMEEKLPYKNMAFFTGDAVVTCAGHILLIKRKVSPGKGLYALPGGFFDGQKDLDLVDTAIRELKEETKIKTPYNLLTSSIVSSKDFGDFNRSERWRVITKATYIKLPEQELPIVKGGDDASEALWVPFADIKSMRDKFFEDHVSIIDAFLNIL